MSLQTWINSLQSAATGVADWTGAKFWQGVNAWRSTYGGLIDARNELRKHPPAADSDPVVKAEYSALMTRADTLYERAKWLNDRVEEIPGVSPNGLGALPVLPAALVAGIAGVTYLVKSLVDEISRYVRERRYVAAARADGKSELQAMAEFQRTNPPGGGLFGDAAQLVWPLAIVGAAYLYFTRGKP